MTQTRSGVLPAGAPMRLFGLAGWSGSGKTTLLERLLPELLRRGVTVSTIKHAHHDFDVDQPGKDSHRHRMAGAREVLVASSRRWALMHELAGAPEPDLAVLVARMTPVDLLLIEGYKRAPHPKLLIHRAAAGPPPLPGDFATAGGVASIGDITGIVAIASDTPLPGSTLPVLSLEDAPRIAEFLMAHCRLLPGHAGFPA